MIAGVAVLLHPPILVPEVTTGAARELRGAYLAATRSLARCFLRWVAVDHIAWRVAIELDGAR